MALALLPALGSAIPPHPVRALPLRSVQSAATSLIRGRTDGTAMKGGPIGHQAGGRTVAACGGAG